MSFLLNEDVRLPKRSESSTQIAFLYGDLSSPLFNLQVIVEKDPNNNVPDCTKRKFLVPHEITVGAFMFEIRRHIPELNQQQAIYLFVGTQLPDSSALMYHVYEQHHDEDGFLYVMYSGENAFGH
eukprot:TRINITY_DN2712_c0_g1_i16.p1 TRINITY_DN2712_c0_g1~~TRINITY_DN2712_c0_g1_i16.p1  ORF type:complete len:125 (-),score=15.83 TRINITY_DN2712_c0_g1_i16:199-573(-)